MKNRCLAACLALLLLLLSGVWGAQAQSAPSLEAGAIPMLAGYEALLLRARDLLLFPDTEDVEVLGMTGLLEAAAGKTGQEALQSVGYLIEDLNGNGVPELIIGSMPQPGDPDEQEQTIFAVYAMQGERPLLLLEGWARNRYSPLGGGRFFYQGADGAMRSAFGVFALSGEGPSLLCEEFYFTEEKEGGQELDLFHNALGLTDPARSTKWRAGEPAFWQKREALRQQVTQLDLLPFSAYSPAPGSATVAPGNPNPAVENQGDPLPLRAQWAQDAPHGQDAPLLWAPETQSPAADILLTALSPLYEVRLLHLAITDSSEDGKLTYITRELSHLPSLAAGQARLIRLPFYGDLPSFALSFLDGLGRLHTLALTISGKDGSLELTGL